MVTNTLKQFEEEEFLMTLKSQRMIKTLFIVGSLVCLGLFWLLWPLTFFAAAQ